MCVARSDYIPLNVIQFYGKNEGVCMIAWFVVCKRNVGNFVSGMYHFVRTYRKRCTDGRICAVAGDDAAVVPRRLIIRHYYIDII